MVTCYMMERPQQRDQWQNNVESIPQEELVTSSTKRCPIADLIIFKPEC